MILTSNVKHNKNIIAKWKRNKFVFQQNVWDYGVQYHAVFSKHRNGNVLKRFIFIFSELKVPEMQNYCIAYFNYNLHG